MPKGMEWSMLSKDEKERLRGLSKEHAENIGLHILAAYDLEEEDPEWALAHAKWAARQASRVDFARETLAFIAYRQGDYKTAAREFRTAFRMNGYLDYLPFIADCERGMGNVKKAVDVALSDNAKQLQGEAKVEMFLVLAGAYADVKQYDKAVEIADKLLHAAGVTGEYKMRAAQAEQNFLEEAGREDEARQLDDLIDKLEAAYADEDIDESELVVDNDLSELSADLLEDLGITEDDAQFAPADEEESDEDEADGEDAQDASDGEEGPVEAAEERRDDAIDAQAEVAGEVEQEAAAGQPDAEEAVEAESGEADDADDEQAVDEEEAETGAESAEEPAEEENAEEEGTADAEAESAEEPAEETAESAEESEDAEAASTDIDAASADAEQSEQPEE